MVEQFIDSVGIRIICSFLDDIYSVADMLTSQDDVAQRKDYIKIQRKYYRSLYLVIEILYFSSNSAAVCARGVQ